MLRRLLHSIREQNWTAIVIEFVLLVLGVFIGMQVSNWNSERATRFSESRHLEEIGEDLRADVPTLDLVRASALIRISAVDLLLGETRPNHVRLPTGETLDMPSGPPIPAAHRNSLLPLANLVRATTGNRTGLEALMGAGGMQSIQDRKISRQIQEYYAQLNELVGTLDVIRQSRNDGTQIGYPLGLSAFGEMDADRVIAIVRASPAYSGYLRTVREWAAIELVSVDRQKRLALTLLDDIDRYLGKHRGAAP